MKPSLTIQQREEIRARMQAVAKAVEGQLPQGYRYFLITFSNSGAPGEYVSNAHWPDVADAMIRLLQKRHVIGPSGNN